MKQDWRPRWLLYNREAAAVELLEASAAIIESGGSVPVAVALASAGAQYFADRVQREQKGTVSALFAMADSLEVAGAPPGAAKLLRRTILNRAGSIRHDDRAERADEEMLTPELATILIVCGAADWWKATRKSSEKLREFMKRRNAAALGDGFGSGPLGDAGVEKMREFIERWGDS